MVTLSAVTTPSINVTNNREQAPVRDDTASRERLSTTKPAGASIAKTDADTQKNYRQQQDFADARQIDPSTVQTGNRRGSLLDLSV